MDNITSWLFLIAVVVLLVVVLVIRARVDRSSLVVARHDSINTVRAEEDEATELAGVHPPKDLAP